MAHLEDLTTLVLRLSIAVVLIDASFVAYVLYRRIARNRFYRTKDAAQEMLAAPVAQFISGELDIAEARPRLQAFDSLAERTALEELLFRGITPDNHDRVSQLLIEMGYVEVWARAAFGRKRARQLLAAVAQNRNEPPAPSASRFPLFPRWLLRTRLLAVRRAVAVSHLRRLSRRIAAPFLREALRDSSPLPRRIAIAALGRQRDPDSIPLLLAELKKAVEDTNDVSVRVVKAALTQCPAAALEQFVPLLHDASARLRFFVIDIIREICAGDPEHGRQFAAQFSAELQQLTADPSSDVRARTPAVIRHLHQIGTLPALRRLLNDENEFVRLHAVRACADPFFAALIPELVERLGDRRWRVREAAVRSLAALGAPGISQVIGQFLSTRDRYASEQLSDHMQRSGVLETVVARLPQADAYEVCRKLIAMKHSCLLRDFVVHGGFADELRSRLFDILAEAPDMAMVEAIAATPAHPLQARARELAQVRRSQAAGAN